MDGEVEFEELNLVYRGRRLNGNGRLAYSYQVGDTDEVWAFKKNIWPGAQVGTVVKVLATKDGAVSSTGRKVVGAYDLKGVAALWAAQEAAEVTMYETQAMSKRKAREVDPPLEEALLKLRIAYLGLAGVGRRAAFLDWVNVQITDAR